MLCTVPDQDAALREIHRVLKPGGLLCFLEHVRADTPGLTRIQRALDAAVWPHLFGGCHLGRDTATAIERAGFSIATQHLCIRARFRLTVDAPASASQPVPPVSPGR